MSLTPPHCPLQAQLQAKIASLEHGIDTRDSEIASLRQAVITKDKIIKVWLTAVEVEDVCLLVSGATTRAGKDKEFE